MAVADDDGTSELTYTGTRGAVVCREEVSGEPATTKR
jgi:hypothetical protein